MSTTTRFAAALGTAALLAGTTRATRSYAIRSRLTPPTNSRSCFGIPLRDNGHSLVPEPPARITT